MYHTSVVQVFLDNEAVQALGDRSYRKHRQMLGELDITSRRIVAGLPVRVAVPTTVRVEAGWNRTSPAWVCANRLPITDIPLDRAHADAAAGIRQRTRVSVAGARTSAPRSRPPRTTSPLSPATRAVRRVAEGRRVDVVAI